MVVIWNLSSKKCILCALDIKYMFFYSCYHISFQNMQPFSRFCLSKIPLYINRLHLSLDSEWQVSSGLQNSSQYSGRFQ